MSRIDLSPRGGVSRSQPHPNLPHYVQKWESPNSLPSSTLGAPADEGSGKSQNQGQTQVRNEEHEPAAAVPAIATSTIRTRFLLVSDTHDHAPFMASNKSFAFRQPLPTADVLLHAGDLTEHSDESEFERTFAFIKSVPAPLKIVIAGNHDKLLDRESIARRYSLYPDKSYHVQASDRIYESWTSREAVDAGIIYLEEGTHTFTLSNGAKFTIYTSPFTPRFGPTAFTYDRQTGHFNSAAEDSCSPIPNWPAVDIVVTHGPPCSHLDTVDMFNGRKKAAGCYGLLTALQRARPRLSVFGHIHEGWGAEVVDWERESARIEELRPGPPLDPPNSMPTPLRNDGKDRWSPGSGTHKLPHTLADATEAGYAYIDGSRPGHTPSRQEQPLRWGKESLLVNAAILSVNRKPVQAPWVVDLDLPKAIED